MNTNINESQVKKYVLMCQKSEDIQELRKGSLEYCDYYFNEKENRIDIYTRVLKKDEEYIWLPTQYQLQELLKEESNEEKEIYADWLSDLVDEFCHYKKRFSYDKFRNSSFEQLWLMLLMFKKFKKRWCAQNEKWEEVNGDWDRTIGCFF